MNLNEIISMIGIEKNIFRRKEKFIRRSKGISGSFNILQENSGSEKNDFPPNAIIVDLKEGGFILLQEEPWILEWLHANQNYTGR
jgi:hypothetical protein